MKALHKALLLGAAHLALVLSMGGKYLMDRATRPRVWMRAAPVDPNLPIRGRYVVLSLSVPIAGKDLALDRMSREQWIEMLQAIESGRKISPPRKKDVFTPISDRAFSQIRIECRGSEAWGYLEKARQGAPGYYPRQEEWRVVRTTVGIDLNDPKLDEIWPMPPTDLKASDLDRWLESLPSGWITLRDSVAFFIPEKVPDPSRRAPGEELWVEVTLPKQGPPRPIRLAVKTRDRFTVLDL